MARWVWIVFALILARATGVTAQVTVPMQLQDAHQGRTLEEWLLELKPVPVTRDGDVDTRGNPQAVRVLSGLGARMVPLLIDQLRNPDGLNRCGVAGVLREIGPAAEPAVAVLVDVLSEAQIDDPWQCVHRVSREALAAIGSPAVPALIRAFASEDEQTWSHAAAALERMGADAAPAVPALRDCLNAENKYVGLVCAQSLAMLGQSLDEAIAFLLAALADTSAPMRIRAIQVVGRVSDVGGLAAVRALTVRLSDDDPEVRGYAAMALMRYRSAANESVPALLDLLEKKGTSLHLPAFAVLSLRHA